MAFLCTDALSSVDQKFYPYLWFIPFAVSLYANVRIDSIGGSLIDIADFEIKFIEPLFGEKLPKWETYLFSSQLLLRGRAKVRTSLQNWFWITLAVANAGIGVVQIFIGPIFRGSQGQVL